MAKKVVSDENWNIDYFNFLSVNFCPLVFSLFRKNPDLTQPTILFKHKTPNKKPKTNLRRLVLGFKWWSEWKH